MNKIFGPILIPDKKILRLPNNAHPKKHFVFLSASTIATAFYKFHKNKNDNNVTINHEGVLINGVKMINSFLVNEKNRKQLPIEFDKLPNGTWMVEYHIQDKELWKRINSSELNGFSIEGIFYYGDPSKI